MVNVAPASEKLPPRPVPPKTVREDDATAADSRTTIDRCRPAGTVAGGTFSTYAPTTGCGPTVQTPLSLHTVHSDDTSASTRSPLSSTTSKSTATRGLNPACHAGCSGSTR